ncbi:MAG: hypothetical protein KKD01_14070 [Proteobacteria bacterium]|nr:hypothetical protein [Pseudomonadota bacterium]MBU1419602.1 hypothetical protein [Pseudomonadota bacterium]MBU1455848.1 hypothetical protein [Pseudomonadota bacterium]
MAGIKFGLCANVNDQGFAFSLLNSEPGVMQVFDLLELILGDGGPEIIVDTFFALLQIGKRHGGQSE